MGPFTLSSRGRVALNRPIALALAICSAACTSAAPPSGDSRPILITGDSIGPVSDRGPAGQLRRASQVVCDTVEEGVEAMPESIIVIAMRGDTVRAAIDSDRFID